MISHDKIFVFIDSNEKILLVDNGYFPLVMIFCSQEEMERYKPFADKVSTDYRIFEYSLVREIERIHNA